MVTSTHLKTSCILEDIWDPTATSPELIQQKKKVSTKCAHGMQ
jgi:hypothetical protein